MSDYSKSTKHLNQIQVSILQQRFGWVMWWFLQGLFQSTIELPIWHYLQPGFHAMSFEGMLFAGAGISQQVSTWRLTPVYLELSLSDYNHYNPSIETIEGWTLELVSAY